MNPSPLIAPIVALVAWSLVMMVWLYAARLPAMRRAGSDFSTLKGTTSTDIGRIIPAEAQWKAHNYTHLMEQPTIFYAIVVALILMGFDAAINVWLAWGYVGLRVVHSLVQATYNKVGHRFALFALSSLCLISLTVHAVLYLLRHG